MLKNKIGKPIEIAIDSRESVFDYFILMTLYSDDETRASKKLEEKKELNQNILIINMQRANLFLHQGVFSD